MSDIIMNRIMIKNEWKTIDSRRYFESSCLEYMMSGTELDEHQRKESMTQTEQVFSFLFLANPLKQSHYLKWLP